MAPEFAYDVFLSHSSRDKSAVRALAEKLRSDGLRVWFDEWIIVPGMRIDLAIEKGLENSRRLVLIMSPYAFGSDWVGLERGAALYRDPANAELRFLTLLLDKCDIPDMLRPYAYIDYRARSNEAYEKLLHACKPQHRPVALRPARGSDGRYELAVHLSLQGDQLHHVFYNHQHAFLDETYSAWQPLQKFLGAWRAYPTLCQGNLQFTNTLWQALCGSDDTIILSILRKLAGEALQTPIYEAFRVRIYTQEPFLAELPWALTTWQNQPLSKQEWTFELTAVHPQDNAPRYRVDLPSPFPVMLVAPASDTTALEWDMHRRDVEQKFLDLWRTPDGSIHTVSTRQDISALHQQKASVRLLYYYGSAQLEHGKLCLQLPDHGTLTSYSIDSLVQEWGKGHVQVVFLNLIQQENLSLGTALAELSQDVPLIIVQTTERSQCRAAQSTFLEWLHDILSGHDPLKTLHAKGHASAWRNMDHWHIDPRGRDRIPMERLGHHLLDRTAERLLVNHAVDELIARDKRLTCILAYAEKENRPDLFFSEQARDYLRTHASDKVSLELCPVPFPTGKQPTREALEMALRRAWRIDEPDLLRGAGRTLENLRETRFAGKLRGNVRPLVLLDWQTWQTTANSPVSEVLETWINFHCELLCAACPKDFHILAGLAVESEPAQHSVIKQLVDRLQVDRKLLRHRDFTLENTAHLQHVSYKDLVDFFIKNQEELQCFNQDLCFDLVNIIYRQTNGRYDAILRMIEQRNRHAWEILREQWQQNG